jgi:pimeloyl-ACP methyl ester carboxylesterase
MTAARCIAAFGVIALALLVTGCEPEQVEPTPTRDLPTPAWTLLPSPTVDPLLPAGDGSEGVVVGASNPTQAALAAEGEPDQPVPTRTPLPTQAFLPVTLGGPDGLLLQGTYYSAPVEPAPAALLLHMRGSDRSAWEPLAARLQAVGYAVLAMDLRGYGATGGQENWLLAQDDVRAMLAFLAEQGSINGQIVVIGASIGANLGLNACVDTPVCAAVVLLSPGLDYRGITTADALPRLGARPVLIVASEGDNNNPADSLTLDSLAAGDHQLVILPAAGHGTAMLAAEPTLIEQITTWLTARVPPP